MSNLLQNNLSCNNVNWNSIEYYDPAATNGVVFLFKPDAANSIQNIVLKGLDWLKNYTLTFQDGTNSTVTMSGSDLMTTGINITLNGTYISELMWIQQQQDDVKLIQRYDLLKPGELAIV